MLYMFETIGTMNFKMLSRNCKLLRYLVLSLFCCNPPICFLMSTLGNRLSICIDMLVHLVSILHGISAFWKYHIHENKGYTREYSPCGLSGCSPTNCNVWRQALLSIFEWTTIQFTPSPVLPTSVLVMYNFALPWTVRQRAPQHILLKTVATVQRKKRRKKICTQDHEFSYV
jgi:hypothetical protein